MDLLDRITELCKEKGISKRQMEKEAGLGIGSTSKWKNGFRPNNQSLQKVSSFFGVSVSYLLGESEFKTDKEMMKHFDEAFTPALQSDILGIEKGMKIPVLGDVAAGEPIFAIENYADSEEISQELASTGKFFGLRIKGDSMSPRIDEGDVVIVRQQDDAETGDIVIVLVNGESATCKRLMKYTDGISLISFNPAYEPIMFSNKEIESLPVQILGKVIENRQKY